MDTKLARTFLTIVTAGNFISAADRPHVSQPTVSTRIHTPRRSIEGGGVHVHDPYSIVRVQFALLADSLAVITVDIFDMASEQPTLSIEDEAGGCSVRKKATLCVSEPPFSGADAPTTGYDDPFSPHWTRLWRDRSQKRDLELQCS